MNSQRYSSVRLNKRISVNFQIVGHGKNSFIHGKVKSLSQQGALISIKNTLLDESERIHIVILSENGQILWRLQGAVRMSLKKDSKEQNLIIIFESKINEELTNNTEKEF